MDTFREEIYKMVDFLFLCGERLLETESFILELTKRKTTISSENWRKQIAEYLDEAKNYSCIIDILDKRTNVTFNLNQLNPLKIRNLYMELAAHLDLDEGYDLTQSENPIIYKFSQSEIEEKELIYH
ncbi:MAG: hypothetical protein GPJ51_11575 [Candidatus Heimdallarchaeota archaeon]|nr:hypothetical protein [Candidatus Heimdallarchaeota archaeon]